MEKTYEQETTTVETVHEIYCDRCGAFFGKAVEDDDGYYENPWKREWRLNPGEWYTKKGDYCVKCCQIVEKEIVDALRILGFKKGWYEYEWKQEESNADG